MSPLWNNNINPDDDQYKVLIKRDTLIDTSRDNRPVKIKTYYPVLPTDAEGKEDCSAPAHLRPSHKLPLIIWSHGLGGSVDGAAFLSRYIASYGYVITHVQHLGTDMSLWEGKPGHPWDIIRDMKIPRAATLNRFQDIPFALDNLPDWYATQPEINALVDLDTIGMSGHSFGSLTTQVMAGMMFPDEKGVLRRNRDARFKAGILYSPGPIDHLGLDEPRDVYGSIDLPMLHMTGTDDGSPIEDWDYKKRLDVYNNVTEAKQKLLILKDGDHMVFNGSRGKLGQNPNRETHERIIKIMALAYWDAMLKNDEDAREWLNDLAAKEWLGDDGSFE